MNSLLEGTNTQIQAPLKNYIRTLMWSKKSTMEIHGIPPMGPIEVQYAKISKTSPNLLHKLLSILKRPGVPLPTYSAHNAMLISLPHKIILVKPKHPLQRVNKYITWLGITQVTPKVLSAKDQSYLTVGQCSNKCSTVSFSLLFFFFDR